MRLRLLPLPLPILQGASFRLTAQWQHDFVTERLGGDLPDARSKSTLSVTAGKSLGPVDLDGSVGFVLLPRPDDRPQLAAYQVSAALSDSAGRAVGWHHEPSGKRSRGTYVIEGTRSKPDKHGVYTAEVVVEGKQKEAPSTFFPKEWSQEQVEAEIAHAYKHGVPGNTPFLTAGYGSSGIFMNIRTNSLGEIITAYPLKGKGR